MLLRVEDFRLIPARDALRDPRTRHAYLNLLALLMQEEDVPATIAQMENDPLYDPADPFETDDLHEFVLTDDRQRMLGTATLEHNQDEILMNDAVHPAEVGKGYGSIILAHEIKKGEELGFANLKASVYDPENRPSYQRFERLCDAGLANRQPVPEFRGLPVRAYRVPTHYPVRAYYTALLPQ